MKQQGGGRNSDSATRTRKTNHRAARAVKKGKEEAVRRGKMATAQLLSKPCGSSPGQRQQQRPTNCMALLQNRSNAARSGPLARILFHRYRSWEDFPSDAAESLKRAFAAGMPSSVVEFGGRSYLVDFLRMHQFDMKNGTGRSIGWIDVHGKCFFPQQFGREEDGDDGSSRPLKLQIEVAIRGGSKTGEQLENAPPIVARIPDLNQSEEAGSGNSAERIEITLPLPQRNGDATSRAKGKAVVDDSGADQNHGGNGDAANTEEARDGRNGNNASNELHLAKPRRLTSGPETGAAVGGAAAAMRSRGVELTLTGCAKLVLLEEAHPANEAVKNLFLAGMKTMDSNTQLLSVHWCAHRGRESQARMHAFERYAAEMKAVRGSANVRFAWHASSPKTADSVVVRGLGRLEARTGFESYGVGVYLSAQAYPQLSASHSKPVVDGKCTLILCRVILGNMEQLVRGTRQSGPCSDDFDSGVDNLRDPKLYIIWKNRMNTHVIPEYVVTFKVSEYLKDPWARRRSLMPDFHDAIPSLTSALTEIPVQEAPALLFPQFAGRAPARGGERPLVSNRMPNMSFQTLFAGIREQLSEGTFKRLANMYEDCKAGKTPENVFVEAMRAVVGDKLLIASIFQQQDDGAPRAVVGTQEVG